jgi:flagellar assembly factor FliW
MEQTQTYSIDGLQFAESDIIYFESGIPGFLSHKKFVISHDEDQEPFHWLHSVDDPRTKFVLINPMMVDGTYDPNMTKLDLEDLQFESKSDMMIYTIVTLNHQNLMESTANLNGPILINIRGKKGKQIILDDSRYSVKTPIMQGGA